MIKHHLLIDAMVHSKLRTPERPVLHILAPIEALSALVRNSVLLENIASGQILARGARRRFQLSLKRAQAVAPLNLAQPLVGGRL